MYYGMFYDYTLLLLVPAFIFVLYTKRKISSAYSRYSKINGSKGISGAQVARQMLDKYGLQEVTIEHSGQELSDHYDPKKKAVRLSDGVYDSISIAAVSIAAHECGHAIQHSKAYTPLVVRDALVKPLGILSNISWPLIFLGIIITQFGYYYYGSIMLDIGIVAFASVVLFHGVTLPVELDASKRAMEEIKKDNILAAGEIAGAKKVLSAAAMTYVAALAVVLAQLIRLLLIRGRR